MQFSKYQGLGNDFILLDALDGAPPALPPARVQWLCDRRFGVGADGVLLITRGSAAPFRMQVFNADGSVAEMCGNGLRCVARYLRVHGAAGQAAFAIETGAGVLDVVVEDDRVAVEMGAARDDAPMTVEALDQRLSGRRISLGNPHFVLYGDWSADAPGRLGPAVERHAAFPAGVNVSFARRLAERHVALRVWERGCGLTMACGTGACATVAAGWWSGTLPAGRVQVDLPGGTLWIEGSPDRLRMIGPAVEVYRGVLSPS